MPAREKVVLWAGPLLAALLAGICIASQGAINSELSRHVGQMRAVAVSISLSFSIVALIVAVHAGPGSFAAVKETPRWAMIGGLLGVTILVSTIIAVPRIGVAATTGAIVAGQVIASAIIDRFGLLGVVVRPLTPGRLAGLVLVVVAVALVTRG